MRILHVISSLDPARGGTVACVRELAQAMKQRGHVVHVASLSDSSDDPWIRDFPAPCSCLAPSFLKYSAAPRLLWWLFRHAHTFDLIVVNGLWQFQGLGTALIAWLRRRPYIVYVHGMLGPLGKTNAWKRFKKFIYWLLFEYWVVRRAQFAVFTSEEEARLARRFFPFFRWREAVVGNGVSRPRRVAAEARTQLVRRFPDLAGKRIVLCLGRVHPGKGCDILLKSFAAEFLNSPQYQLVFAGPETDSAYGKAVKQLAGVLSLERQVTWTGMLVGDDKEAMLAMASILVSPSHHENFGFAVVEAVARGLPAIVTDKVNTHGALGSGGAAIVCEDNVEGLRGALRDWLAMSKQDMDAMGERQRALYERAFTPERAAEALEGVMQLAVNRHPLAQPRPGAVP